MRGRLKQCINHWKSIGASSWVLRVINDGYHLPLLSVPLPRKFTNHRSACQNATFVEQAIIDLLECGSVQEIRPSELWICNPLGVVPKRNNKLRLILDLRYLNTHLSVTKFSYEDLRTVSLMLEKGDWFFSFDLKSGYHHIDIGLDHRKYLAFSFTVQGLLRYFWFASLPFGLATAPFVFSKVLRPLVKSWRSRGHRALMYLDDGIGLCSSKHDTSELASVMKRDLVCCGFSINEEKSDFEPKQIGEFLGYILNLVDGIFTVPDRKVKQLLQLLDFVVAHHYCVTARSLAQLTGIIISMGLALGQVSRLMTRSLYVNLNSAPSLSSWISLSEDAVKEIHFWIDNFAEVVGEPIWKLSPKVDVISFSDASGTGWGGYLVNMSDTVARGNWSAEDLHESSTFRELKAVRLVLESFAHLIINKECVQRTDNQGTCSVLCNGSRIPKLQKEAVRIFALCRAQGIRLTPEWIPRCLNQKADYWSKVIDTNDWMLNPVHFQELDILWGPHTVDRFSSYNSKQLVRFCSRWPCPGCEVVDSFTVDWKNDNNWMVPPVYLIPRILRHMRYGQEFGTLIVPLWPSAPWWPLFSMQNFHFYPWVRACWEVPLHQFTFLPGSAYSDLFGNGIPSSRILALRLDFRMSVHHA